MFPSILISSAPLPSLLLIPSGIGCEVGGYAGDAIPSARLLAAASGCLITHPNVMNGASLFWNDDRIQYVEGFSIDKFVSGDILLRPVRSQRIGVLFDAGIEEGLRQRHLHTIDACRASLGLDIGPVITTDSPLQISFRTSSSGSSWGEIAAPDSLLRAGEDLKAEGASAIAVVTKFPEILGNIELDAYRQGKGVDVIAGAEAVISHLLVKHLCMPCAHAPALSSLPLEIGLDPRAAGEELGHTFLSCVLVGLSRAPDILPVTQEHFLGNLQASGDLHVDQLGAVVVPDGALGGEAILACLERDVPLIVVSNPNVLSVNSQALNIENTEFSNRKFSVLQAANYPEAAGLILLLREGINVDSLYRPITHIREIN